MPRIFYSPVALNPIRIIQLRLFKDTYPDPPDSAFIEFDAITNTSLIQDIIDNWLLYTINKNGVLFRNGIVTAISSPSDEYIATKTLETEYPLLPTWAKTGTAEQAETYITAQIFNGQTQAQVDAYIDATIKNITTANVAQINAQLLNIRTVLKAASAAIITMRSLFIITAKLLIYIRDLVIRFRK